MTFAQSHRTASPVRLAALLALALAPAQVGAAGNATAPVPLAIGESFTIESAVLGETRRINVYAAPAYGESPEARRPVLYMPDGGLAEDFLHIAGESLAGLSVVAELSGVLEAHAPAGLRWVHAPMPAEKHPAIYHPAAPLAFRAMLGPLGAR